MKKGNVLILFLLLLQGVAFGQVGCFTFQTDTIGCAPFFVRAINCNTPGEAVAYNFDLANQPNAWFNAPITSHGDTSTTYNLPGYFVFGQAVSGQFNSPFTRRVHVYNQNVKPLYSLNFCIGTLSITLPDTIFKNYLVNVAGTDYARTAGMTLLVPIAFAPGENRKRVPFTISGVMSTNCGDNTIRDTAIVYNSIPTVNLDTVAESLSGTTSTFRIRGTAPAVSTVRVGIRDQAFQWDTLVTLPFRSEQFQISKAYPDAVQPTFSLTFTASCPSSISFKDSITGVLPRLGVSGTQLSLTLPPTPDPYIQVQAELNDLAINVLPSPYQAGQYLFDGEIGCRKNNCLSLWFTDRDRGLASVFIPAEQCQILSSSSGDKALVDRTLVDGQAQYFFLTKAFPLASVMLNSTPLSLDTLNDAWRITAPYQVKACYDMQLLDSCGNDITPEGGMCAMRLFVGALDHISVALNWSPPGALRSPINRYVLMARDASGNVLNRVETSQTEFVDRSNYTVQPVRYTVEGIPDDSALAGVSVSNSESVFRPEKVVMPSAFSPNADGQNDTLSAYVFNLKTYALKVTNRWGEIVYFKEYDTASAGSPKSRAIWDGTFRGRTVQTGAYFATVTGRTYRNEKFSATQMVQVVQ